MATMYKEQFASQLVELMQEGNSVTQVATLFGVSKDSVYSWAKDPSKPEFMEAFRKGKTAYEAYWERIGQQGIKGILPKFNPAAWIYNMKVRCKDEWRDESTQTIELKNDVTKMSSKDIDDAIKALLAQRQKNKDSDSGAQEPTSP